MYSQTSGNRGAQLISIREGEAAGKKTSTASMLGMHMPSSCCEHLRQARTWSALGAREGRHAPARALLRTSVQQASRPVPLPRSQCAFGHTLLPARPANVSSPPPPSGVENAASAAAHTWSRLPVLTQSCLRLLARTALALYAAHLALKYVTYAANRAKEVRFPAVRRHSAPDTPLSPWRAK